MVAILCLVISTVKSSQHLTFTIGLLFKQKSERMGAKRFYFWDPEDDGTFKQVTFSIFP